MQRVSDGRYELDGELIAYIHKMSGFTVMRYRQELEKNYRKGIEPGPLLEDYKEALVMDEKIDEQIPFTIEDDMSG